MQDLPKEHRFVRWAVKRNGMATLMEDYKKMVPGMANQHSYPGSVYVKHAMEYLVNLRMEKAKGMLRNSSMQINAIAIQRFTGKWEKNFSLEVRKGIICHRRRYKNRVTAKGLNHDKICRPKGEGR